MINLRLTDLDELVLTVRDKTSRIYILEAVNAYRVGAYRSAIVSTWIAVSYDIIAKIRELNIQGDNNAKTFMTNMGKWIKDKQIIKLQELEQNLLKMAHDDFEFLSDYERDDLLRLQQDRHLCAHPALVVKEEQLLFQPLPELVRVHIVHAVKHLLQHPPTQGKKALDRIMDDMKKDSFPHDCEDIYTFLHTKYLNNAKESLIRNLIIVLLKIILKNDVPAYSSKKPAILCALMAVAKGFDELYQHTMSEQLSKIAESLEDQQFYASIFLLLKTDGRCWNWLNESEKIRFNQLNILKGKPLYV
jgi:hypothetical protein